MVCRRDVADREDIGVTGAQRRVDEHAAVGTQRQARRQGQVGVRCRADGDQHGVGVNGGPVAEPQAGRDTIGGGDLLDRCTQPQVDPVLTVQLGEHLGHLPPERAQQRQFGGFDHGDIRSTVAGIRGHFQTDPAAADDRQ